MNRWNPNGCFKVDGMNIPTPDAYTFGIKDLSSEETGRTLDGEMHKDVVAVKDYYNCTWNRLSWQMTAYLLNAVDAKSSVSFTHIDPRYPNQWVTGDFYVGNRSGGAMDLTDLDNAFAEISFQFTRI